jgi:hypothetical protein
VAVGTGARAKLERRARIVAERRQLPKNEKNGGQAGLTGRGGAARMRGCAYEGAPSDMRWLR